MVGACKLLNPPRYALPIGVRAVDTITASFIVFSLCPVKASQRFLYFVESDLAGVLSVLSEMLTRVKFLWPVRPFRET